MYLVVCFLKRNIIIPLYSIYLLHPLFRHQKEVGQHNLLRNISHGSFAQIPSGANLQAMANAAANRNSNQHLNVPEITVGGLVTIKASINVIDWLYRISCQCILFFLVKDHFDFLLRMELNF